jgi:hypothetical protein
VVTLALALATASAHDGLAGVIELRVPAPTAGAPDRTEQVCLDILPSLSTAATEFDEGDYGASCTSDGVRTTTCLTVAAGARWPSRFPDLVCLGLEHELRTKFVPGWDPFEVLSDGVTVARMVGPRALDKTLKVWFVAPGWPDIEGRMPGGECGVRDGKLRMAFLQDRNRSRVTCTLFVGDELRQVPVRLVDRLTRCPDQGC